LDPDRDVLLDLTCRTGLTHFKNISIGRSVAPSKSTHTGCQWLPRSAEKLACSTIVADQHSSRWPATPAIRPSWSWASVACPSLGSSRKGVPGIAFFIVFILHPLVPGAVLIVVIFPWTREALEQVLLSGVQHPSGKTMHTAGIATSTSNRSTQPPFDFKLASKITESFESAISLSASQGCSIHESGRPLSLPSIHLLEKGSFWVSLCHPDLLCYTPAQQDKRSLLLVLISELEGGEWPPYDGRSCAW